MRRPLARPPDRRCSLLSPPADRRRPRRPDRLGQPGAHSIPDARRRPRSPSVDTGEDHAGRAHQSGGRARDLGARQGVGHRRHRDHGDHRRHHAHQGSRAPLPQQPADLHELHAVAADHRQTRARVLDVCGVRRPGPLSVRAHGMSPRRSSSPSRRADRGDRDRAHRQQPPAAAAMGAGAAHLRRRARGLRGASERATGIAGGIAARLRGRGA